MRSARFILAASSLLLAAPAVPAQVAKVGQVVDYKFSSPPVNGIGVSSLESLRGKPTLVEFWGTY